jgi:glyoxylase-like metal-dependent hydrolase (beta-lactamase superfamily II)
MIRIPTPFKVGDVNVYVLGQTLIDTGPATPDAFNVLTRNVDLKSVRKILVTHGHVDHHGLAARIKRISGARVYVCRDDLCAVTDYRNRLTKNLECYKEFMKKSGVSKKYLLLFSSYYWYLRKYGKNCEAESFGEKFETEMGSIEVIPTPGHTPGSCCLLLGKTLYSGDTLLPGISTNPSINAIFDERCGLEQYQDSLKRIATLSPKETLPGHGGKIEDHRKRIKEIFSEHEGRKEKIIDSLSRKSQTLKDVSKKVFGEVPPTEITLALAECYDHLRILEKEGIAEITEDTEYHFRIV